MTDAIVRLIPGAMSDESSALSDSFQDNLLAHLANISEDFCASDVDKPATFRIFVYRNRFV